MPCIVRRGKLDYEVLHLSPHLMYRPTSCTEVRRSVHIIQWLISNGYLPYCCTTSSISFQYIDVPRGRAECIEKRSSGQPEGCRLQKGALAAGCLPFAGRLWFKSGERYPKVQFTALFSKPPLGCDMLSWTCEALASFARPNSVLLWIEHLAVDVYNSGACSQMLR